MAQDEVYFHNGTVAKGTVSEVTEQFIKFCYQGENVVNTISRNALAQIRFSSGRVQEMSQKVIVNSPNDWEKFVSSTTRMKSWDSSHSVR